MVIRVKPLRFALAAFLVAVICLLPHERAKAQTPVPTPAAAKQILKLTRNSWIQFRNFEGQQIVYFTSFLTWKCALKEIRFSVNSKDLAKRFPLPNCNPDNPLHVDPNKDLAYLTFPLGEVETVSIQVVYQDDTKSAVHSFMPCDVDGDQTCGKIAK